MEKRRRQARARARAAEPEHEHQVGGEQRGTSGTAQAASPSPSTRSAGSGVALAAARSTRSAASPSTRGEPEPEHHVSGARCGTGGEHEPSIAAALLGIAAASNSSTGSSTCTTPLGAMVGEAPNDRRGQECQSVYPTTPPSTYSPLDLSARRDLITLLHVESYSES